MSIFCVCSRLVLLQEVLFFFLIQSLIPYMTILTPRLALKFSDDRENAHEMKQKIKF
jgi:hypothetical protein